MNQTLTCDLTTEVFKIKNQSVSQSLKITVIWKLIWKLKPVTGPPSDEEQKAGTVFKMPTAETHVISYQDRQMDTVHWPVAHHDTAIRLKVVRFLQLFEHGRLRFTNHDRFSLSRVADCYHHGPCTCREQQAVKGAGSHELECGVLPSWAIVSVPVENNGQLAALVHMSLSVGFCRAEPRRYHHGPCTYREQQAVKGAGSHELECGVLPSWAIVSVPVENNRQLKALVHTSLSVGFCWAEPCRYHHGLCTCRKQQAVSSTGSHELECGVLPSSATPLPPWSLYL